MTPSDNTPDWLPQYEMEFNRAGYRDGLITLGFFRVPEATMRRIIAETKALRARVGAQEGWQGTHAPGCGTWDKRHWECEVRELELAREGLRWYDFHDTPEGGKESFTAWKHRVKAQAGTKARDILAALDAPAQGQREGR